MKEALCRFAAYATGSASKECLLYVPVDNHLPHGSFNGRPLPELDKQYGCVLTALMKEA